MTNSVLHYFWTLLIYSNNFQIDEPLEICSYNLVFWQSETWDKRGKRGKRGERGERKKSNIEVGAPPKNCDYSDIVPISFYPHPPEGERDSNYRDKINVISTPPPPPCGRDI